MIVKASHKNAMPAGLKPLTGGARDVTEGLKLAKEIKAETTADPTETKAIPAEAKAPEAKALSDDQIKAAFLALRAAKPAQTSGGAYRARLYARTVGDFVAHYHGAAAMPLAVKIGATISDAAGGSVVDGATARALDSAAKPGKASRVQLATFATLDSALKAQAEFSRAVDALNSGAGIGIAFIVENFRLSPQGE